MHPTELLESEHRIIEPVLDYLEALAGGCASTGRLDGPGAGEALEFLRGFADRCHHGKEEDELFPMMEARGFPREGGPLAVMLQEHERGRALIRVLGETVADAAAGDESACESFVTAARSYVELLREHIQKEDHCLFPMARRALGDADVAELRRRFDRFSSAEAEAHDRLRALGAALAERAGADTAVSS